MLTASTPAAPVLCAPDPSNAYAALTYHNASWIKRFSHGRRLRTALALVPACAGETVLDVGTGDAYFLRLLVASRPGVHGVGVDPTPAMLTRAAAVCAGVDAITLHPSILPRPEGYAWVTCFETLEHLTEAAQLGLLRDFRAALAPGGRVVLSVPLEIGLAGFAKNMARLALGPRHDGALMAYVRAALGVPGPRVLDHVGFDHRALRYLFTAAGFSVERTVYSPVPALGWLINVQVFWVLRRFMWAADRTGCGRPKCV